MVFGFLALFFVLFLSYSAYTQARQKVVVINPGHSIGYDSGATSAYKDEATINEELAGKVVRRLNSMGYKVYITHTTDDSLASHRLLTQEQGSHLKNVGDATNSVKPDLSIAIHHNSGSTSASGYEFYWSSYRDFDTQDVYEVGGLWSGGDTAFRDRTPCGAAQQSRRFADILKNHMAGIANLSHRTTIERDDYLPAHATSPCILYEGGYLSNREEAAYLSSEAYQNAAAERICAAVSEFLGEPGERDTQAPSITRVTASAEKTSAATYTVTAEVSDNDVVTRVLFPTWTQAGGQDDIRWVEGECEADGTWTAQIHIAEHNNETGKYITHVYAYDAAGNAVGVAAPTVEVVQAAPVKDGLSLEMLDSNTAVVYAKNLGAKAYKFAVWSEENGQDDLVWSDGKLQTDGSYAHIIRRSDHKYSSGTYIIHCYSGDTHFIGEIRGDFSTIKADPIVADVSGGQIFIRMNRLYAPNGAKNVRFAVWSEENAQDDLIWYSADKKDGSYIKTVNLSAHKGTGTYWIHAYLTDRSGRDQFIGAAKADVGFSSSAVPDAQVSKSDINTIQVSVTGVNTANDIVVPLWSEKGGQDDLVWYEAQRSGSRYSLTVPLERHDGPGLYNVHIYIRDPFGNLSGLKAYQIDTRTAEDTISLETPIMGSAAVTATQLATFYTGNAPQPFPDYYVRRGVDLNRFAEFYIEEAAAEGVRADLAFAQAMHETGYLRFGGDVNISQFNFAGLGATGGVPGEDFAAEYGDNAEGIRMGIRAQIQHLKAYGSAEPLNQECVDRRYKYVTPKGKATTIGGLTGTWAADKAYAQKIVAMIQDI